MHILKKFSRDFVVCVHLSLVFYLLLKTPNCGNGTDKSYLPVVRINKNKL